MKSILYASAALMIGASVYGFVDYKQTHNKKEFKEMYATEEKKAPLEKKSAALKKEDDKKLLDEAVTIEDNKIAPLKTKPVEKKIKKRKKLDTRIFSRAPLREDIELPPPVKTDDKKIEEKEQ